MGRDNMKGYQKLAIGAGILALLNLGLSGLAIHLENSSKKNAPLHETVKQYPIPHSSIDDDSQRFFDDNVIQYGGPVYPPLKD
jgi:hypothetical protein